MDITPQEVIDIQAIVNDDWMTTWSEISQNQIDAKSHAVNLLIRALKVSRASEKVLKEQIDNSPEKSLYVVLTGRTCWGIFSSHQQARETAKGEQLFPCKIEEWKIDSSPGQTYYYDKDGRLAPEPSREISILRRFINLVVGD